MDYRQDDELFEEEIIEEELEEIDGEEGVTADKEAMAMTEDEILLRLMTGDAEPVTKTYWVGSKRIPITIKGLTEMEFAQARKEATRKKKVRGQWVTNIDDATFSAAIVAKATVKPDFNDRKLLEKFRVSSGTEYLKRNFYSGTLNTLCDKVLTLSGFDDDLEEVKNL